MVALPAFTISRLGLQKEARAAIEAIGCPFATTSMEKCIIDESHPQFAGMYSGVLSPKETGKIVEGAELVLDHRRRQSQRRNHNGLLHSP